MAFGLVRKIIRIVRSLFLGVVVGFSFVGGAERIYIDITSPEVRKFNIALLDLELLKPSSPDAWASSVPKVISRNLEVSGLFAVLNPSAFLTDRPDEITDRGWLEFRDWSLIGADGLVVGNYKRLEEDEKIEVELRLYDVAQSRLAVGRRYEAKVGDLRSIAHHFSNEIIETFTGERGPFGSQIVYVSDQTGNKEIYRMEFGGSEAFPVTQNGAINLSPRWSPKADRIVYTSYRYGDPDLLLFDLSKEREEKLVVGPGLQMGGEFSPDGQSIAYVLNHRGNSDIYLLDLSTKERRRLTSSWGLDVSPRWSPDGQQIVFVSDRSGTPQLYRIDLTKGDAERLTYYGKYNASPAWSPKGDRIAYAAMEEGHFQIYTIDPESKERTRLTYSEGNDESPSWSPDGRFLVFSSDREGDYNLYLMNANGSNVRRLTFSHHNETMPHWSGYFLWGRQEE